QIIKENKVLGLKCTGQGRGQGYLKSDSLIHEITRISKNAFISYAPNKWCGYDWGHVNGPVIPFLSKYQSLPLLTFWHKIRNTGRNQKMLRKSLNETFYISRYHLEKELRKYGTVKNVFRDFINFSIRSDYHFVGGKLKTFLLKHKILKKIIITLLLFFKIEPMVYLFFTKTRHVQ
ncbi:MAG: hypothetical protein JW969_10830, partial [Spirochaetales bacterium]|nr:hypothetical protein [Spirochaetales bacterium]